MPSVEFAVTFNPPHDVRPFGVDVSLSECSPDDIQDSREVPYQTTADTILGLMFAAGPDYK
jgi:hypothetical protein